MREGSGRGEWERGGGEGEGEKGEEGRSEKVVSVQFSSPLPRRLF